MKINFFKKLSKQKRKELAVAVVLTAVALGLLGFGLIRYQYSVLAKVEDEKTSTRKRLTDMDNMVRRAALTEEELEIASQQLAEIEERMAPRDIYSWFISTVRPFKDSHKIDFQPSNTSSTGPVNLLPNFPYQQASLTVEGAGRYFDLGTFIADFENSFPHIRILNLAVQPASGAETRGMLSFRMDIITLVKPNPS
jgi:hypothetical protein